MEEYVILGGKGGQYPGAGGGGGSGVNGGVGGRGGAGGNAFIGGGGGTRDGRLRMYIPIDELGGFGDSLSSDGRAWRCRIHRCLASGEEPDQRRAFIALREHLQQQHGGV